MVTLLEFIYGTIELSIILVTALFVILLVGAAVGWIAEQIRGGGPV